MINDKSQMTNGKWNSFLKGLAMMLKRFACLLALALFIASLQGCKSESARSDLAAQPGTQTQTSPRSSPQPASETVVPPPSKFNEVSVGSINDSRPIRMELERKGDDLTGGYFYERTGAFNVAMKTLELKGRIDGDGNVTLTEMAQNFETGNPQKTGEFKG